MFGEEESVEQFVHLQKAIAIETHGVLIARQEALIAQLFQRSCKPLFQIHAELIAEVRFLNAPELHLKNQFANHALFVGVSESPENRKGPLIELFYVGSELMLILEMGALDMREGSDSQPQHVG